MPLPQRTDVFNNNTFIVHDTVIPYGTENKLFLFFIFLRREREGFYLCKYWLI
jgi:hypothetical protein